MTDPFSGPADQLGFVVPDLEQAITGWLEKGVGPWLTLGGAMLKGYEYLGKSSRPQIDVAFSQVGKVQLELIQPVDDEASAYRDFLASGRSGLQHVGWFVEDFAVVAAAADATTSVIQRGSWSGVHFTYYGFEQPPAPPRLELASDKGENGAAEAVRDVASGWDGKIGELIELNQTSRETFAAVADAAAGWDGRSRPVRHLLSPLLNAAYQLQVMGERVERWLVERRTV